MDNNGRLIIDQIRNKNIANLYVLEGDEPFYIDMIIDIMAAEIIPEEEKDFNQKILYSNEVTVKDIINEACGLPMFGERILIIVKEGQLIKQIEQLATYFENPNPTTTLVLEYKGKKIDKRIKFSKIIQKTATHFVSEKVSENDLPRWIMDTCHHKQLSITYELATMLSTYLGNDLQKISNEIDKIRINEPTLSHITAAIIERQVGISREYNIFEYGSAVFQNDKAKIARMLNYFNANPKEAAMPAVLGSFHSFLQRVFVSYHIPNDKNNNRQYGIYSDHRNFSSKYPISVYHQLVMIIEEYSRKAVGIDTTYSATPFLLKEMTARILNIMDTHAPSYR